MLKLGSVVGEKYVITKRLGSGRFSEVYSGITTDGQAQPVAVKLLTDKLENPYFRAAFDVEVMALKSLNHENIVSILDSGTTDEGLPYLVMELCELGLKPAGRWDASAVPLTRALLGALQFAHASGVIHRDIKPQHIRYADQECTLGPKLVDFGIAKIRKNLGSGVTLAGYFTPGFACADQMAGQDAKPAFDLYAVAACLYWYITKREPDRDHPLADQLTETSLGIPDQFRNFLVELTRTDETAHTAGTALRRLEQISAKWVEAQPYYIEARIDLLRDLSAETTGDAEDLISALQVVQDDLDPVQDRFPILAVQEKADDPVAALSYYYRLIGRNYLWRLVPRPAGRSFLLHRYERPDPMDLEGHRLSGLDVPALWYVVRVGEQLSQDATPIAPLCEQLVGAEIARLRERSKSERREKLVDIWDSVCNLQRNTLLARDKALVHLGWTEKNGIIEVFLKQGQIFPKEWIVGQRLTMTRKGGGMAPAGILVRVTAGMESLLLKTTENVKLELLAAAGDVRDDRSMELAAIDRQQRSLTSIRQGRAVNPRLPDVICGSRMPLPIVDVAVPRWFDEGLDEAKREAVTKALGCQDLLLIQGPPGTGKTVAIAELVLQIVRQRPKDRILLVSQSNVAVDHAIGRIVRADPDLQLVRLARNEEKVAPDVKEWQLQGRVDVWREHVLRRSKEYLASVGLDPTVGAEVSSIQDLLNEIETSDKQIKEWQALRMEPMGKLSLLSRQAKAGKDIAVADLDEEALRTEIENIDEELKSLREDKEAAVELARESFKGHGIIVEGEPSSWREHLTLIGAVGSLGGEKADLIALWDSWRRQFGKGVPYQAALAKRSRILCGTCLGVAAHPAVDQGEFDWVIVDEAGRATPPEILVPLAKGKRAILVGDHMQLPPVVDQEILDTDLEQLSLTRADLEKSLFQMLFEELPESHRFVLDQQYRMRPAIGRLISEVFYKGQLRDGKDDDEISPDLGWPEKPVTWLSTSSVGELRREGKEGHSWRNDCEIRVVSMVLARWQQSAIDLKISPSVGIISGYDAQRRELIKELDPSNSARWAPLQLEVNTVDAFQGRERDMIIYSAVRSNTNGEIGFLSDLRRLNVALSRARRQLVIVGDAGMLRFGTGPTGNNPFRQVLDWIRDHSDDASIEEVSL